MFQKNVLECSEKMSLHYILFKSDTYSFGVLLLEILSGLTITAHHITLQWSGLSKSLSLRNCAISIIKCLEFEHQLVLPTRLKLVLMFQASLHNERWKRQGNFGHEKSRSASIKGSCVFRTARTIEHEAPQAIGHFLS